MKTASKDFTSTFTALTPWEKLTCLSLSSLGFDSPDLKLFNFISPISCFPALYLKIGLHRPSLSPRSLSFSQLPTEDQKKEAVSQKGAEKEKELKNNLYHQNWHNQMTRFFLSIPYYKALIQGQQ